jgi:hypothetical protein
MPRKQPVVKETTAPARKPAAPRVKAAQHRAATPQVVAEQPQQNGQEMIAKIAYGYWEARGCTGGDPAEDWLRAEAEFRKTL